MPRYGDDYGAAGHDCPMRLSSDWVRLTSEIESYPPELENVLIVNDLFSIPNVAFWSGNVWRETHSEDLLDVPIAWMPLPKVTQK